MNQSIQKPLMVIAVSLFSKVYREAVLLAFQVVRVGCKGCLKVLLVTGNSAGKREDFDGEATEVCDG